MIVGIDVDGTITDIPALIRSITHDPSHEIHIITFRDSDRDVRDLMNKLAIRYDYIHTAPILVEDLIEWKVGEIVSCGVEIMIDDMPEILRQLPPHIQRVWVCDPEIYGEFMWRVR